MWYGIVRTPMIDDKYCDEDGNPYVDDDGRLLDNEGYLVRNEQGNPINHDGEVILGDNGLPVDFSGLYYYHHETTGELVYRDQLKIIDGMNDFVVNPNPFEQNPFDAGGIISDDYSCDSFNGILYEMARSQ